MDWKGAIVEIFGFLLATLFLINGSTKDGEAGLIRFNDFIESIFSFRIPFIDVLAHDMFYLLLISIIGVLLMFKGKTIITFVRKIVTFGR